MDLNTIKYYFSKATEEKEQIKPLYNSILELTDVYSTIKDEGRQEFSDAGREVDADVLDAISSLVSYIMSSILPRSSQWADVDVDEMKMKDMYGDQAQNNIDEINKYLSTDVKKTFKYIQSSNYYEEIVKAMKTFVRLGTGCFAIRETGIASKPFLFQYVGIDNLFILNDNFSKPNIVFKKHPEVNAIYIKDVFGKDVALPDGISEDDLETEIDIYECVIPEYDEETTLTSYNYMILSGDMSSILLEKVLEYNPFVVFCWDKLEGNSWGTSIVLEQKSLLEELKEYQDLYNTQARKIANPPGIFYGNVELFNSLSMEEAMLNYGGDPFNGQDSASFQTIGVNGSLMPLDKLITDCRNRFKSALMVQHLTMSAEDVRYSTATSISIMNEMFRRRFANTYELINSELVEPTFLAPFIILLKYNMLNLTTEVLPYTNIRYVSELSKADNTTEVNKLLTYAQYVSQLQQFNQLGVALDLPKAIAFISDKLEVQKDLVPGETELKEIQDYQRQMMQQQMMQNTLSNQGETQQVQQSQDTQQI